MSLIGGDFDSSGVWDGTYHDWKHAWIPLTITVVDQDIKEIVECPPVKVEPVFRVEVYDTETEEIIQITSSGDLGCVNSSHIISVDVSRNVESQSDSFSLQFADARAVDPRLNNGLQGVLDNDIRKHLRIYAGFKVGGVEKMARIFTGVIQNRSGSWAANRSSMTFGGYSLSFLLTLAPGTISNYVGYLSGLLMEIFEQAGFESYILAVDDRLFTEPFTLIADTIQEALVDLFQIDSTTEWFVNAYGTVYIQSTESVSQDDVFIYQTGPGRDVDPNAVQCGNIFEILPSNSTDQVTTEVSIVGGNLSSSITYIDSPLQERLGRRTASINSPLLTTAAESNQAGRDAVSKTTRSTKSMPLRVFPNPLLDPFMRVTVIDSYFGSEYNGTMAVLQIAHSFDATKWRCSFSGEFDDEV